MANKGPHVWFKQLLHRLGIVQQSNMFEHNGWSKPCNFGTCLEPSDHIFGFLPDLHKWWHQDTSKWTQESQATRNLWGWSSRSHPHCLPGVSKAHQALVSISFPANSPGSKAFPPVDWPHPSAARGIVRARPHWLICDDLWLTELMPNDSKKESLLAINTEQAHNSVGERQSSSAWCLFPGSIPD